MPYGTGSSGYTSAARIRATIDLFLSLPTASQTSVRWSSLWSSRAVRYPDVELPYIIGGGESAGTAAGWSSYVYRLYGSTRNTSSGGIYGVLGLPHQSLTEFRTDRTTLAALTTHVSGTADADHGRRIYEFLVSTVINRDRYRLGGPHQEILIAWAAAGSSAAPSS